MKAKRNAFALPPCIWLVFGSVYSIYVIILVKSAEVIGHFCKCSTEDKRMAK